MTISGINQHDIDRVMQGHEVIVHVLDHMMNLADNQYTDSLVYDKEQKMFTVTVITETDEDITYDETKVTAAAVAEYMVERQHER
ncbi:hypothetical protein VPHF86_0195 [Vibrio phage F86]